MVRKPLFSTLIRFIGCFWENSFAKVMYRKLKILLSLTHISKLNHMILTNNTPIDGELTELLNGILLYLRKICLQKLCGKN